MSPEERLQQFMDAMKEWELKTFTLEPETEEFRAAAGAALQAIFNTHLSAKGKDLKHWGTRLASGSASSPPQYDQELIKTEDGPKPSTVYAYTKHRTTPRKWWRYAIITGADGDPRIDDLKSTYVEGGEWGRGMY